MFDLHNNFIDVNINNTILHNNTIIIDVNINNTILHNNTIMHNNFIDVNINNTKKFCVWFAQ